MKFKKVILSSAFCVLALYVNAQETNEVEQLKRQLQQMQENFQKVQRQQKRQIDALTKQVDALLKQQQAPTISTSSPVAATQPITPTVTATTVAPTAEGGKPWSPTDPIRIGRPGTYVDIGLVGTFAAGGSTAKDIEGGTQPGGHDPNQRGFTVQGVEANFSGAVDPYFRGNANILFSVDAGGESFLELEEAWLETVSLPANLQLRAGQILTDFGRINPQHPHAWAFVDVPLVNARFLGPDGLRNPGARLAWLAPTPFFSELSMGIQNSHGETASSFRSAGGHHHGGEEEEEGLPFGYRHPDNDRGVRGFDDLLFSPRLATSFDITDNQTLLLGASGAFGPNANGASGDTHTQIYGLDFTWKWKSPNHEAGFPFVMFQSEGMLRRYELGAFDWDEDGNGAVTEGELVDTSTGLPAVLAGETVTDYGFYSQLLYGFRKGWIAGLRLDYVAGDKANYERKPLTLDDEAVGRDPFRDKGWRISPNLTWYPSEFSKIRLQYNYDDRRNIGTDHSVWLQFEFLLGAHAAHKF
jgi:hypothetical protein